MADEYSTYVESFLQSSSRIGKGLGQLAGFSDDYDDDMPGSLNSIHNGNNAIIDALETRGLEDVHRCD